MIDQVIARLQPDPENGWTALKTVAGALDLADIMENQFAVPIDRRPAAFVMLAGEQAGGREVDIGNTAQIVTQTVSIAFAIGSGQQVSRMAAQNAVLELRSQVLGRLLGWAPDELGTVFIYGGLAMLALRPRVVWFQMNFVRQIGATS
jgi:hypothetical protein